MNLGLRKGRPEAVRHHTGHPAELGQSDHTAVGQLDPCDLSPGLTEAFDPSHATGVSIPYRCANPPAVHEPRTRGQTSEFEAAGRVIADWQTGQMEPRVPELQFAKLARLRIEPQRSLHIRYDVPVDGLEREAQLADSLACPFRELEAVTLAEEVRQEDAGIRTVVSVTAITRASYVSAVRQLRRGEAEE